MITDEDTSKIVNKVIEANKQLFYDKLEMDKKFESQRKEFNNLQTSVESFAVGTKNNADEIKAVNNRVSGHESWINQVGPKIGVEFKP